MLKLNIKLTEFNPDIKPVIRKDSIKAFVNWRFVLTDLKGNPLGEFVVHNGTVRLKKNLETGKEFLSFDPPSVATKKGYIKVFIVDNKELFKKLCDMTIDQYCQMTGEIKNLEIEKEALTEAELDEMPF